MSLHCTFSVHAVERYIKRFRPGLTYDQAVVELEELCKNASYRRTTKKAERWLAQGEIVFVVKPSSNRKHATCITLYELREDPEFVPEEADYIVDESSPLFTSDLTPEPDREADRMRSAQQALNLWTRGGNITRKAAMHAAVVLGCPLPPRRLDGRE